MKSHSSYRFVSSGFCKHAYVLTLYLTMHFISTMFQEAAGSIDLIAGSAPVNGGSVSIQAGMGSEAGSVSVVGSAVTVKGKH